MPRYEGKLSTDPIPPHKTLQVSVTLSGLIDVRLPEDVYNEAIELEGQELADLIMSYVDLYDLSNQLNTAIENV